MSIEAYNAAALARDNGILVLFMASAILVAMVWRYGHRLQADRLAFDVQLSARWLLLGAVLIRVVMLLRSDLWYDETFTAAVAGVQWSHLPTVILGDVHPPLAYLPTWISTRLIGSSEIALRLPSLVFGGLSIYLVYRVALEMIGTQSTALLAAWLLAFMPAHIHYSVEARGYTLLLCAVLWAILAILKERRWEYTAACWLLPLIHTHGFFYLAALGVCAVVYHGLTERWIAAVIRSGLVGLGWLPFALMQSGDVMDGFWLTTPGVGRLLWFVGDMTLSNNMPLMIFIIAYVVLFAAIMLALFRRWSDQRVMYLWLIIFAGVPLAIYAVSVLVAPVFLSRALLPSASLLVIPLAAYFQRARLARNAFVAVMIVPVGIGVFTPARAPISTYFDNCNGADYTYVLSNSMAIQAAYYSPAPVVVFHGSDDLNQSLATNVKFAMGFNFVSWAELPPGSDVCVAWSENALNTDLQRHYLDTILDNSTMTAYNRVIDTDLYEMIFWRVTHVASP